MGTNREGPPITGHFELVYPSEYVKSADLRGKDVTVVIDHLTMENLVMVGGKRDRKACVTLRSVAGKRLEKRWVVGKTVLRQISAALGGEKDVSKWAGGKITMYPDTCRGGDGKTVECIRVRVRVSQGAADIPEDMAATPAPRAEFFDEAAEEPDEGIPGARPPTVSEARAIQNRAMAARSEAEINLVASDLETIKGRIKTPDVKELRALIAARREALAGVVPPDAEPPAGAP